MGLTDRSRLSCIKARQKLQQQKLNKLNRNLYSTSGIQAVSETEKDTFAQEQAWNKYIYSKAIYQETKDIEHWRYMQECLSEYEKTLMSSRSKKAI